MDSNELAVKKRESKKTIPIPPGETIKEILADSNITTKVFAQKMNLTERETELLLEGKTPLTATVANKLEKVLQVPAVYWKKLEEIYRRKLAD